MIGVAFDEKSRKNSATLFDSRLWKPFKLKVLINELKSLDKRQSNYFIAMCTIRTTIDAPVLVGHVAAALRQTDFTWIRGVKLVSYELLVSLLTKMFKRKPGSTNRFWQPCIAFERKSRKKFQPHYLIRGLKSLLIKRTKSFGKRKSNIFIAMCMNQTTTSRNIKCTLVSEENIKS